MLRKILIRAGNMCEHAYLVQALTAVAALALLLFSLIVTLISGGLTADTYSLYRLSQELFRMPAGILLIGIIASVCIEEIEGNTP